MNAVDAGGPGAYSGHWNGRRLFFDVPELTVQAGNYNAQELAAQLPRELERSMRESPHLRHIAALLPHVRRVEMHTNGIEPPIQTSAATAADIADVVVNWCCAKLYRTVGEENLAHAAARKAELLALREHSAITGPIRPVQISAPVKVAAEPPSVPQTYAEAREQYLKWLAERGLEDPDGWLPGAQQDSSEDERGKEEDIPADFEGLDAWYAEREKLLPGPLKAAYMTATFTKGFLAGAGGIVLDLLLIAGRYFNGMVLCPLSGGKLFQEDYAFSLSLNKELLALPGNLLSGRASDALIKQLNMLLARLNNAESAYGRGKALAEVFIFAVGLFTPEGLAANPALAESVSSLSRLLGRGKKGSGKGTPKQKYAGKVVPDPKIAAARQIWGNEFDDWLIRYERLKNNPIPDTYKGLISQKRIEHILLGDSPTAGGHLYPPAKGKTPFPKDWGPEKIIRHVTDIATDPTAILNPPVKHRGKILTKDNKPIRRKIEDVREDVTIHVVVEPYAGGEGIVTAYPI